MKKRDLEKAAGISHYTINKLNHGDNVTTTDVLEKSAWHSCTIDDIMEFVLNKQSENKKQAFLKSNLFYKKSSSIGDEDMAYQSEASP